MFNSELTLQFLQEILNFHSPTGYTHNLIQLLQQKVHDLGYRTTINEKGNLLVHIPGESQAEKLAITAHVDTLGLMVRSIASDGTLKLTALGGPTTPTLDGEYCTIITRDKKQYRGTILSASFSSHVHRDANEKPRKIDDLIVRIDEVVKTKEDVEKLGIQNGDIVAYDPKVEISESGFIKSRFLDDKASVAVLFSILVSLTHVSSKPKYDTDFIFSTYEEVGHGSASIPQDITMMLAVDMGCIGEDLACSEFDVSICAKDSSGPYDYQMTSELVSLAKEHQLAHALDIYPFYGSDASAALRGGNNIKAALIGPGVHASHGMERTHLKALENTYYLIWHYLAVKGAQ